LFDPKQPFRYLDVLAEWTRKDLQGRNLDIIGATLKAVDAGSFTPAKLQWDLIHSQIAFHSVPNFTGGAAKNIYTEQLEDYFHEFGEKYGRGPYEFLLGQGFQGTGRATANRPADWEGILVMPSWRTIQARIARSKVVVIGIDEGRIKLIKEKYEEILPSLEGRELFFGLGFDESDFGIVQIMREADGTIHGVVRLGQGFKDDEKVFCNIDAREVEEDLKDIDEVATKLLDRLNGYEGEMPKKNIWSDGQKQIGDWLETMESKLRENLEELAAYEVQAKARVAEKEAKIDKEDSDNSDQPLPHLRKSKPGEAYLEAYRHDLRECRSLQAQINDGFAAIDRIRQDIAEWKVFPRLALGAYLDDRELLESWGDNAIEVLEIN